MASPAHGGCVNRPSLLLLGIAVLYFVIQATFRRACRNLKTLGRVPGVEGPQNMKRELVIHRNFLLGHAMSVHVLAAYVLTCEP